MSGPPAHTTNVQERVRVTNLPWNAKVAKAAEKHYLSLRPSRPLRLIVRLALVVRLQVALVHLAAGARHRQP